jgi:hypothetical protein
MTQAPMPHEGVTLRQAAMIAAFGVLLSLGVPVAEFIVRPMLIVPGNIEETIRSIGANHGLFVGSMFAYFIAFVGDVVVAWALYVLLAPVNRAVSLLTAWFRLIFAVIALGALLNLATVFRILNSPDSLSAFGPEQLNAQVLLLLSSFQWEWGLGMALFGIHLGLLGYLVYRSGYIPPDGGDRFGHCRTGLPHLLPAAIRVSRHRSSVHLHHLHRLGGTGLPPVAPAQGLEDPGTDRRKVTA